MDPLCIKLLMGSGMDYAYILRCVCSCGAHRPNVTSEQAVGEENPFNLSLPLLHVIYMPTARIHWPNNDTLEGMPNRDLFLTMNCNGYKIELILLLTFTVNK